MTLNNIEPLVQEEIVQNNMLKVVFTCNETQVSHESKVSIPRNTDNKIVDDAKNSVKKHLFRSIKQSIFSIIRSSVGGGTAGRIAKDITGSAIKNVENSNKNAPLTGQVREDALIEAFKKVSDFYVWDDEQNKWKGIVKN